MNSIIALLLIAQVGSTEAAPLVYRVPSGTVYTIDRSDIRSSSFPTVYTVWLRGDHSQDASVKYRRSFYKLAFNCEGEVWQLASTTYNAAGVILDNWDGRGRNEAIRPGTMYAAIEKDICHKK